MVFERTQSSSLAPLDTSVSTNDVLNNSRISYFPELAQPDKDSLPVGLTFTEAVRLSSAGMDVLTHLPVSVAKTMEDASVTTLATTTIALPVSEIIQAGDQLKPNMTMNNSSKQGKGRCHVLPRLPTVLSLSNSLIFSWENVLER